MNVIDSETISNIIKRTRNKMETRARNIREVIVAGTTLYEIQYELEKWFTKQNNQFDIDKFNTNCYEQHPRNNDIL